MDKTCSVCGRIAFYYAKGLCKTHYLYNLYGKDYLNKANKKKGRNRRIKLFTILGGQKCVCKGIDCWHDGECIIKDLRVLQFDHIKGNGLKDMRDKNLKRGGKMYLYYISHPDEARQMLQPLCANCNWCKRYNNNENSNLGRPKTY